MLREELKSNQRPQLFVFDFDGTLVDTMQGFADIAADVMAKTHGVEFGWAREQYLDTSGVPFFQQLERIFPTHHQNTGAAAEFEERKLEGFFSERFDDDVRSTLTELQAAGFGVAVSSNNFQHLLDEFVARESISFSIVLGARENFFKGKDHFQHIEKQLGVGPHEIIFVGDSLMDAQRAHESGVRFVG
jgi:phosphoglycolate phosphatase-like HAD superfamily hydrolase